MAVSVPFAGGCACGTIRYECSAESLASMLCHCRDCQHESGSTFTSAMAVPASAFNITQGNPKSHAVTAASGGTSRRFFCPECGSPLFSRVTTAPDIVTIAVGSLDDPSGFQPQMALWVSRAHAWTPRDPALPTWDTQPSVEEVLKMSTDKS